MEQLYTDKEVLQDALTAEKTATNNYNTYANECVHDTVREAILNCLSEEHKIQEEVFNAMRTNKSTLLIKRNCQRTIPCANLQYRILPFVCRSNEVN